MSFSKHTQISFSKHLVPLSTHFHILLSFILIVCCMGDTVYSICLITSAMFTRNWTMQLKNVTVYEYLIFFRTNRRVNRLWLGSYFNVKRCPVSLISKKKKVDGL